MNHEHTLRVVQIIGFVLLIPVALFYRIRSQVGGGKLDRRKEGLFILLTLRPIGIAGMVGLICYLVNPSSMAWSSVSLPLWLRWSGVGIGVVAGALLLWAFHNLGKNLTDTVVTREKHTLVTTGPYRWVRHPFYVAVLLGMLGNSLMAANWFIFLTGALVFALMTIRTRKEEELLLARFGDEYRDYMKRTGRFWPKIGR
jgi:protein-S-isoprenylcysteine O-methyltransferase Ste14